MTVHPRLGHQRSLLFSQRKESERQKDRRRTVDAAPTAETLPRLDDGRAAIERGAWAARVCAHGARVRREVRDEECGVDVRRIVVRRGARFKHEDAEVWVRGRETARDDAACRAALCRTSSRSEGGRARAKRERRTSCDDDIVFFVERRVSVSGHFFAFVDVETPAGLRRVCWCPRYSFE